MKILATSDLHGNLSGLDFSKADIAVIAGDIAPTYGFGKWDVHRQLDWINKKFFPFAESFHDTQFVVIPGNHDMCLSNSFTSAFHGLDWRISPPANCHMLCDSAVNVYGLRFYGMPWVPIINHRWAFEAEHDILTEKCSHIPDGIDVLITHSPPRISGSALDISLDFGLSSEMFGSHEITNAIYKTSPKFVFCGHIHSGSHAPVMFENTTVYNVSRVNENYDIAYEPTLVNLQPAK